MKSLFKIFTLFFLLVGILFTVSTKTSSPAYACSTNDQCPYCTFCDAAGGGACLPYTGACANPNTPTPAPTIPGGGGSAGCGPGQFQPHTACIGTGGGGQPIVYACTSVIGCGANQCSDSAGCASTYCYPSTGPQPTSVPTYTVSGNVFLDANKNQRLDAGENNYTGGIIISSSGGSSTYPTAGSYVVSGLVEGTYTVTYSSMPSGYSPTVPQNGPPPSFSVTVGGSCATPGSPDATCTGGNVTNLNFGISNANPWIQSNSSDIRVDSGISNPIPPGASCQPYTSTNGGGGTPGIVYSGNGSANFGGGQASANPYNWQVGGLTYSETFSPVSPNVIRTSYNYISSILNQNGTTPTDISSFCSGGMGNCALSSSLPNGVYIANGDLTLTGSTYTFPTNKNFVILVHGNLTLKTKVLVPNGSTAFFTVSGNINVDPTVGQASISSVCTPSTTLGGVSTGCDIEGYYSTDQNFNVQGSAACPTPDLRLNIAGSVVVNAALNGGNFNNQRDLCAGDLQCPVFAITERPDFILNSPTLILNTRRIFQELAP